MAIYIIVGEKKPSPTSARDRTKIKHISWGQPSPDEIAFRVELGCVWFRGWK